jgi:hypothetical protein
MNEQQAEELSALEMIYPECIEKHMDSCFDLYISVEMAASATDGVRLSVLFPEAYPDEAPIVSYKSFGMTSDLELEVSRGLVEEVISRSIGSPMMFDIVTAIRDHLEMLAAPVEEKPPEIFKKVYDTYTQVNLESFLEWKKKYDGEIKECESERQENLKNEIFINGLTYAEVWAKPTGRELFEKGQDIEEVKDDEIEVV